MKGKKLVSMLTASALVATMAMPVMAADGGSFDVDVTTKTGILRVEVPTNLVIAVDQFETSDVGSQVYSDEFTIVNRSEVNVKVNVTSTATVGSNVTLAAKRADAANATGANGTAWLAVAAKKSATNYEAAGGTDDFTNLNETAANVSTFANNGAATTAAQTFYLEKGTSPTYKLLKPAADKKNVVSYAQFYELTVIATQPTDNATLKAEVDKGDVYVGSEASGSETDKASLTKIAKGSKVDATNNSWASGKVYYSVAKAATPAASVDAAKLYVYGELTAGTNANAGFRYIGVLSSNKEVWDATDVSRIKIAYTIQGLPQSTYEAADNEGITYGLYKEKLAAGYKVDGGVSYLSTAEQGGFAAAPTSIKVGSSTLTASDYTYHDNGWISLATTPAANTVIELVVNGTTYKVTTPAS